MIKPSYCPENRVLYKGFLFRPQLRGWGEVAEPVHNYGTRVLRDLHLAHAVADVVIPNRKLRCPCCGIRTESHDFADPYRRHTARFERAVKDLCRILPIGQVARHYYGLSWHAVKEVDRRLLREVAPLFRRPALAGG